MIFCYGSPSRLIRYVLMVSVDQGFMSSLAGGPDAGSLARCLVGFGLGLWSHLKA